MIKELFLPTFLGNRRLIPERIVGLTIHENDVSVAVVFAKPQKTIIEKLAEYSVEPGTAETYSERVGAVVKRIFSGIKRYDRIRVSIPASSVIFNEIEVAFTDPDKIRMILSFEIESILPFSLDEAVYDFIITKQDKEQGRSVILVAAIRAQDLQEHLTTLEAAGVNPDNITVDLFSLYSLFQQIPDYATLPGACALVKLGLSSTRVAFMQEGRLRLTRHIPRGLSTIIKTISDQTGLSNQDVSEKLIKYGSSGSGDEKFDLAAHEHIAHFFNEIQFTLNSFSLKLNYYEEVSKILFAGKIQAIRNFIPLGSDTLQIACEAFDASKIGALKGVKSMVKDQALIGGDDLISLGASIISPAQRDFDLRQKEFAKIHGDQLIKQMITACVIIGIIIFSLGLKGFLDIRALAQQEERIEQQEIAKLKQQDILPSKNFTPTVKLAKIFRDAQKIIKEKEEIWEPFSQRSTKPLDILLEITRIIDKKRFDVTIKEVRLTVGPDKKPLAEIDGVFRSKTGSDHFTQFAEQFAKRFKESVTLAIAEEPKDGPAPEGGVEFTFKMKPKEA